MDLGSLWDSRNRLVAVRGRRREESQPGPWQSGTSLPPPGLRHHIITNIAREAALPWADVTLSLSLSSLDKAPLLHALSPPVRSSGELGEAV
jgi:hypothetical protein